MLGATPPKELAFSACQPPAAIKNDAGNTTRSVSAPAKGFIVSVGKTRFAIHHSVWIDAERPGITENEIAYVRHSTPLTTALSNNSERRGATKRRHSLSEVRGTINHSVEKRRRELRRHQKTP
jgi:hypothetical protein